MLGTPTVCGVLFDDAKNALAAATVAICTISGCGLFVAVLRAGEEAADGTLLPATVPSFDDCTLVDDKAGDPLPRLLPLPSDSATAVEAIGFVSSSFSIRRRVRYARHTTTANRAMKPTSAASVMPTITPGEKVSEEGGSGTGPMDSVGVGSVKDAGADGRATGVELIVGANPDGVEVAVAALPEPVAEADPVALPLAVAVAEEPSTVPEVGELIVTKCLWGLIRGYFGRFARLRCEWKN